MTAKTATVVEITARTGSSQEKVSLNGKHPEPTATWIHVTPAMAKEWLSTEVNDHNRNLSISNMSEITSDMRKDDFVQTGDTIKFDWNGKLADGQHRLQGIVQSGKTQRLLVVRNLDPEVFKYIDRGKKRTAGDVLSIEGIPNANRIAAMAKFIMSFRKGNYGTASSSNAGGHKSVSHAAKNKISNSDVSEFVAKHGVDLQDSLEYGFNKYNKVLSGTTLASLHYLFRKIDEIGADDFCHKLANGRDLASGSIIAILRDKLIADLRSRDSKKMSRIYKLAIVCKAWNIYREKRRVTNLMWNPTTEPFPKPV